MSPSSSAELSNRVLVVDRVTKSYGATKALDEVSLAVEQGEFVALLGPNGAGKSTLFQLLSGLFVSDSGSIQVQGLDIRYHAVTVLADVGVVFQQPTLDLDLTVSANLYFHARLHGMDRKRTVKRVSEELERLDLRQSMDKRCRSLSGGNRRKVELARALLHEPRVLLMDEATVGLDPASRKTLLDDVLELCARKGIAVLWATHLVDEAERADRVFVLHRGRLLTQGTPQRLIEATGQDGLAEAFLELTGSGQNSKA